MSPTSKFAPSHRLDLELLQCRRDVREAARKFREAEADLAVECVKAVRAGLSLRSVAEATSCWSHETVRRVVGK